MKFNTSVLATIMTPFAGSRYSHSWWSDTTSCYRFTASRLPASCEPERNYSPIIFHDAIYRRHMRLECSSSKPDSSRTSFMISGLVHLIMCSSLPTLDLNTDCRSASTWFSTFPALRTVAGITGVFGVAHVGKSNSSSKR